MTSRWYFLSMAASHLTAALPGNSAANPPRDVPISWDCSGRGQCSLNSYQLIVIRPVFRSLPTRCVFVQSFPLRLEEYYPRHNVSRLQWPLVRSLVDKLLSLSPFSCSPLPLYSPRPLARSLCFFLFSLITLVVIDIRSLVAFNREMQSADRVCCQG
jgi:hypothetical protein